MNPPLRALLVEDVEAHAVLVTRQLQRAWPGASVMRVETPEAFRAAVSLGRFDIVISDHALPRLSVSEAVAAVSARGMDVPFIVISSADELSVAADAWKAGAHDFVPKSEPGRLVETVARELRAAEERRAARPEAAPAPAPPREGTLVTDPEGRVLSISRVASELLGVVTADAIGRTTAELFGVGQRALAGRGSRRVVARRGDGNAVELDLEPGDLLVGDRRLGHWTVRAV
ncbi:MAG: response regulator [Planctomycetales bacterium]|nr:response regulator [Planctomycetales bacterium]